MSEQPWVEFTTTDGTQRRVPLGQIEMVYKRIDLGTIHTVLGEVIHVVDVSKVLSQWLHHQTSNGHPASATDRA
jgi:hypothetical protein